MLIRTVTRREIQARGFGDKKIEVDITGMGDWHAYKQFSLSADASTLYRFPHAFSAYWVRFKSSEAARVTAMLTYR